MAKSLEQVTTDYTNSAARAQQDWLQGIQDTAVDPTALAIAQQQTMVVNFQQAVQSGRWAAGLRKAGKQKWQANSEAKAANYGAGIAAGAANYSTAMATWLPFIQQQAAVAKAMPHGSLAQNLAAANAFATALYNRKRGL